MIGSESWVRLLLRLILPPQSILLRRRKCLLAVYVIGLLGALDVELTVLRRSLTTKSIITSGCIV